MGEQDGLQKHSSAEGRSTEKIGDLAEKDHQRIDPRDEESYSLYSFSAYDDNNEQPVAESGSEINSAKYRVPDNSVLISKLNPRINRVWRVETTEENAICSTEFIVLKPKPGVPLDYLYAILNEPTFRNHLVKLTTGTSGSHQRVKQRDILQYEIPKYKESEKNVIAHIYGILDEKVEVNHNISNTALRAAEEVFRHYFVDFGPYQEFKETKIGEIPEGFSLERLENVLSLQRGYSYSGDDLIEEDSDLDLDDGYPMINLGNISPGGGYRPKKIKYCREVPKDRYLVKPGDLIISHTDMTQDKKILGSPVTVPELNNGPILFSHHLYAVQDTELPKEFLYYYFLSPYFKPKAENFASGTTVLSFSSKISSDVQIPIPPEEELKAYLNMVRPMFDEVEVVRKEIEQLAELRDALLPKLMSGEIRVSDISHNELEVANEV